MALDYSRKVNSADRMIKKYGMVAALRDKSNVDRPCRIVIMEYTPRERMGGLIEPTDRQVIVSAKGLGDPPDHETERLVTFQHGTADVDEVLKIVQRPSELAPGGVVVYYELQVRR